MFNHPPKTIHDVSDKAGVSPATVSRVFNAPQTVRLPLRERVQAAALVLGYRPNTAARSLRTQRTKALGVVLPTLLNPVFAECLQGVSQAAMLGGYSIVPITTDYEVAHESRAVDLLLARGVDALILCVANAARSKVLARLRAANATYVLVYNRHARHPCVSVDGGAAVTTLVARLHALGHRRILMVSGALRTSDRAQQRHRGYLRGMQMSGLAPLLLEVPFMDGATDRIVAQLSELEGSPVMPTALVCSNDLLAIRSVRAARQLGLRVPDDLSIAGFDGIALGCDLTPALSTIVQPNAEMGRRSVEWLVRALAADVPLNAVDSLTLDLHFRDGESMASPRSAPLISAQVLSQPTPRRTRP
ncbi:MAG: LacI family DNA-binding transcriptional regulator [Rhizobacter sp.]|nr:LacI family DNA-binding transcriptional regulator [Burkholderiales bacterium]